MVALALAVRLAYLGGYRTTPFFADPQGEALYQDRWALQIAQGDLLGQEVFFRPPLNAYVLAALGRLTHHSYLALRVVQALLGALACLLVLRIGRRLFGPGVGLSAGLLAAFLAGNVYYEAELLGGALITFLALLAVHWLLVAAESPAPARLYPAGLALGLGALASPLLLAGLVPAGLYLLARRGRLGRTRWILAFAFYLAGVATPIVPVTLRNYYVGQDFVPIASQDGLEFYLGNRAGADGSTPEAPELRPAWYGGLRDADRMAEEALGRPLKPSEVSDYWLARGLNAVRQAPGRWLNLLLRKWVLFWQAFEVPGGDDLYFFSRYSFLFRGPFLLTFGAVAPLGLAGVVLALRRRKPIALLAGFVLAYALCATLYLVNGPVRAPMAPLLCVPAAWFLHEAWRQLRRRNWRLIVPETLLFLGAFLFVNADFYRLAARHDFSRSWLRLGAYHAARGEVPQAEAGYRSAVAAAPRFVEGHNDLGVLLMQQGRTREALESFTRAYAIDPTAPRTLNNLAAWYEQADSLETARRWIERAQARGGEDIEVLYNAGIIYGRQGQFPAAERTFRRLLQIEPGHLAGRLGLGKSLVMEKRSTEAIRMLEQVLARDRRQAEAWYFMGVARLQDGQPAEARAAFRSCLEARPGYEPARQQLAALERLAGGGIGMTPGAAVPR